MVPMPPIDLSQVPTWIMSGGFLLALITLLLQIPQLAALPNAAKVGGALLLTTIVGEATLFLSTKLTPELVAQLQPYWAQFLIGLGVIAAYFGIQFGYRAIKPVVKAWYDNRVELRRLNIEAKRASLKLMATPPTPRATILGDVAFQRPVLDNAQG
jgi:hypothetical protein